MNICQIDRPSLKEITRKFIQGEYHILRSLKALGHNIQTFSLLPLRIPNFYLAYGLGILISLIKFRKNSKPIPDIILVSNIESGIVAVLIKFIFKIPFVFWFKDDYSLIASYNEMKLRYNILKWLEKIIPRLADLVIAISPGIRNFCLSLGISQEKIELIPQGVDTELFRPGIADETMKKELNPEDYKIILYVGKINRYYNLQVIVKAIPEVLKKYPKTKFLFVGDGDDVYYLKNLSRELKIENALVFTGFRPPVDIPKIINLSDICVFSLPCGSALAIFEYMACAKPVVLPSGHLGKIGSSEEVVPKDCALLVKNSSYGFACGITFLLDNEEIANKMGKKAKERVVRLHDWNNIAQQYTDVLKRLLEKKRFPIE